MIENLKKIIINSLFVSVALSSYAIASAEDHLLFDGKSTLPSISKSTWHSILENPLNSTQFIVSDNDNNIFIVDTESSTTMPLLSNNDLSPTLISVDSLVLHPNFGLKDKPGYLTLYTAHIEPDNDTLRVLRLTQDDGRKHPFASVVTEWRLRANANKLAVISSAKREVIRVPVPSRKTKIKQLNFNPLIKSWQKGFGYLFLVLSSNEPNNKHPLFSGSLLRINPEKFGLRQYTVPPSNSLINGADIVDEIVATGLGNVDQIIWLKESESQFIISSGRRFKKVSLGDNFLLQPMKENNLLQQHNALSNSLYYRNTMLRNDLFPLVYLERSKQHWLINAAPLDNSANAISLAIIPFQTLPKSSDPYLIVSSLQQLQVFDKKSHIVIESHSNTETKQHTSAQQSTETIDEKSDTNNILILLFIVVTVSAVFIIFRQDDKYKSSKKLLRSNYAKFEVDKENATVKLFRRHELVEEKAIAIEDIIKSEIYLNDIIINSIDQDHSFSNILSDNILNELKKEKRLKMVDDKVRKVVLNLYMNSNQKETLCLYLREGNQRLTKTRFEQVEEQLIDWCWLFSHQLSPQTTEKRVIKPKVVVQKAKVKKAVATEKAATPPAASTKPTAPLSSSTVTREKNQHSDEELVNALNKLVELKSQGFLSEEEFNNSKLKIIEKLSKK